MRLNPATALYADLGFVGLCQLHARSLLPFKPSKRRPLTKEQKQHNRQQAKIRVPAEHACRHCKVFRTVKGTYRGKHRSYGLNWNLAAAISNLKIACRHLNLATP